MSETEWAWLAGFVDGEGCISLSKKGTPTLSIGNTDSVVIEVIKELCGVGKISCYPPKNRKHKDYYVFSLHGVDNLYTVLTKITPYLIVKRAHALLMSAFLKDYKAGKLMWKELGEYVEQFKILNKRGKLSPKDEKQLRLIESKVLV